MLQAPQTMNGRQLVRPVVAAACLLGALAPSAQAIDPDAKCLADKLKHAGKYAFCRLNTESKALRKGTVADFTRCDERLTVKWGKIETKAAGACPITGDLEPVRATILSQTTAILEDLGGGSSFRAAEDVLCKAAKIKQAGRYEQCVMSAESKGVKKGEVADHDRCERTLRKTFAKAEVKADGSCPTTGDVETVETTLSTQTLELTTMLAGSVCGNGVLEAGEQCDGADPASICAAADCGPSCTCVPRCCEATISDGVQTSRQCTYAGTDGTCDASRFPWFSSATTGVTYQSGTAGQVCRFDGRCGTESTSIGPGCCQLTGQCAQSEGDLFEQLTFFEFFCEPAGGTGVTFVDEECSADGNCGVCSDMTACAALGLQCGSSPCGTGGSCGSCPTGESCKSGFCCEPNECGGNCGSCPSGQTCQSGTCCAPSCTGAPCGTNGCEPACGCTCRNLFESCGDTSHCCGDLVCFPETGTCLLDGPQ